MGVYSKTVQTARVHACAHTHTHQVLRCKAYGNRYYISHLFYTMVLNINGIHNNLTHYFLTHLNFIF